MRSNGEEVGDEEWRARSSSRREGMAFGGEVEVGRVSSIGRTVRGLVSLDYTAFEWSWLTTC